LLAFSVRNLAGRNGSLSLHTLPVAGNNRGQRFNLDLLNAGASLLGFQRLPQFSELSSIATLRAAYRGAHSAGEPLIIDGMIEAITKFSNTVMEMDFGNSSKITKSRVLQAYGVSPILLGELENANRASSTVAEEIFVGSKINPLIDMLSAALTQRLAPMFASPRERLVCWIEHAVPRDAETMLKQWELGSRMGFVTRNEYRVNVLNLAAVDGGDVFSEPAGFLPSQQGNDEGNKPEKRVNGHSNRLITLTR
jgi:phage portal protein BeeE